MLLTRILGLAAVVLAAQSSLFAWGREGHRLIAHLASQHLNAKARAEIARLLAPGESLDSVAAWADEIRPQRKETSTWHYINIPVTAPRGDWKKYCPETGCVAGIIGEMQSRLQNPNLAAPERTAALKFLVHFAGDLHQPLHAGDRGDRGGNDVQSVFFNKPTNLHSVWDTPILETAIQRDPSLKARLERRAGFWERRRLAKGSVPDWAWEARDVSRDVAYANLPAARPAVLGDAYQRAAAPAVELQIRRAGLRLASLLNATLGR
ncbi:MAG: S1/P1 nuclease [Acidobacteria bacterium]|nr:S1/P1 nuclease [Acidobacteriota bacterium]